MDISDRRSSVSFSVILSTFVPICACAERVCRMGSEENDRHNVILKYCYPIAFSEVTSYLLFHAPVSMALGCFGA